MHTKHIGSIGEAAVCTDLLKKGYPVFFEFGDLARADLIFLDDEQHPWKVQVKTCVEKDGLVEMSLVKKGPHYSFTYTEVDADIFAVYVRNRDVVLYVPAATALENVRSMSVRFEKPARANFPHRWWEDFLMPL